MCHDIGMCRVRIMNHESVRQGCMSALRVRFHFDFASPYAYLASTQLPRLERETGAVFDWSPLLLGGLFRDLGREDVPLFAMGEARRAHILADMERWAVWWGVPLAFPPVFPIRTVLALRCFLMHPDPVPFGHRVFTAAWAEGRDIAQPHVLRACGADDAVLAAAPQGRSILHALTDDARSAGIFGVPSFVLPDSRMVWGQDRLDMLARMVSGWQTPR